MPSVRTQRYLTWLGIVGTLTSCFGCTLAFRNEIDAARAFLIVAWLVLVPLFGYLIMLRSRASARYKRRLAAQEARARRGAEGQAAVDDLLKAEGIIPSAGSQAEDDTLEPQTEGTT